MTPAGASRLRAELTDLASTARPTAVLAVATVGDVGAATEAKKRLLEIDRRIRALTESLDSAEIVDPKAQDGTRVRFGAVVTVHDENDREVTYRIVGVDEVDVKHGAVSWLSPIARALLNSAIGDIVTFRSPKGAHELEIVRIAYEK